MGIGEGVGVDGELDCDACGARHDNAASKRLPDGSVVPLQSKAYALFCEAQFVLRLRGKERRRAYLEQVEKARGMSGREALQDEILRWHHVAKQSVSESGSKPTLSTMRKGE